MSPEFTRGVLGVLAVGAIAGVGVLLLIPQPTPPATAQIVDPPARSCVQSAAPTADRGCQKSAHRQGPDKPGRNTPGCRARAWGQTGASGHRAGPGRSARHSHARKVGAGTHCSTRKAFGRKVRAAQRRKAERPQAMRRSGNDLSDVGASSYTADWTWRSNAARPYIHGARKRGVAMGNGFFSLFR